MGCSKQGVLTYQVFAPEQTTVLISRERFITDLKNSNKFIYNMCLYN